MTDAEKYARAQQLIADAITAAIGDTVGQLGPLPRRSAAKIVCEALRDVLQHVALARVVAGSSDVPHVLRVVSRKAVW